MIPQEAVILAQTTLELLARKIDRFESPQRLSVAYEDDGTIRMPNFGFTGGEARAILAIKLTYKGDVL